MAAFTNTTGLTMFLHNVLTMIYTYLVINTLYIIAFVNDFEAQNLEATHFIAILFIL